MGQTAHQTLSISETSMNVSHQLEIGKTFWVAAYDMESEMRHQLSKPTVAEEPVAGSQLPFRTFIEVWCKDQGHF